jgi:hypothetical protein
MTFISMARGRVLKEIISNQLYTFSGQSIEACLSRQYAGVDYKEDIIHTMDQSNILSLYCKEDLRN